MICLIVTEKNPQVMWDHKDKLPGSIIRWIGNGRSMACLEGEGRGLYFKLGIAWLGKTSQIGMRRLKKIKVLKTRTQGKKTWNYLVWRSDDYRVPKESLFSRAGLSGNPFSKMRIKFTRTYIKLIWLYHSFTYTSQWQFIPVCVW
jgi:hypothetical protein